MRTCADTYRDKTLMLIAMNAESEEVRNFRLLQRRFIVFNPSKAAHIDSAAEGLLALASQGHSSGDEGHSSGDEGHCSSDEGHSSADEGQLQAPNVQYPAGPASHAATQSSHPGRHRPVLTPSRVVMLSLIQMLSALLSCFFSCSSSFLPPHPCCFPDVVSISSSCPLFHLLLMIFLFVSPMTFLPFLPLHPFCDVKVLPLRLLFFFLLSCLFYCLSAAAAAVSLSSLLLSLPFSAHFLLLISLVIASMFNFLLACDMLPFLLILNKWAIFISLSKTTSKHCCGSFCVALSHVQCLCRLGRHSSRLVGGTTDQDPGPDCGAAAGASW